jgi:hypothetical protein
MKLVMSLLMLTSLFQVTACNRNDAQDDDEITIERQEDYNREDASDTEVVPLHRDNELKLQSDDEVDVDD